MVLTIINIIALVLLAVGYFKGNYTIVTIETWNKVATFYNEYSDGEGGIEIPELSGGAGQFFWDQLETEDEEEEDE